MSNQNVEGQVRAKPDVEKEIQHDQQSVKPVVPGERFQRIKEMIHLPEDEVSATQEPREADDKGLPLMLMLIFGICIFGAAIMGLLYATVYTDVVNIILGNHFTR
jgi:hypothetical protein